MLKFMWDFKGPETGKTIMKMKNVGGLTLPGFKAFHKDAAITVW